MNRTYELMFIVRPDMTEEDLDKLIATLSGVVPTSGGSVQRVDKMGKRRLAYTVRRFHEGIYVLMVVEGGGAVIHELERRLRVTEQVIKFLTVRTDEEQKRLDKVKALRDAKKKVSAQPRLRRLHGGCRSTCGPGDGSSGNGVTPQLIFVLRVVFANLAVKELLTAEGAEEIAESAKKTACEECGWTANIWKTEETRGELWLTKQKHQSKSAPS